MDTQFNDTVAIVTGASSGIGRATALAFAREGAKVVAADVLDGGGEETVEEIRSNGGEAIYVHCDVSILNEAEAMVQKTIDTFGKLNYAFNNAGIEGEQALTAECSEENWDRVIGVNLKGIWTCMKAEIPFMKARKRSAIVNCSSIAGLVGFQTIPAYVASKHGILGLTKTTALEYAKEGIRVNAVCPGVIDTPMVDRFTHYQKAAKAQLVAQEPVSRIGKPDEIAEAVLWLCSEKASFVTGHAMVVDGGWVAQ